MPRTMKTRSFNLRSCKKSLQENKEKSSRANTPSPKKIKSKPRVEQETPKNKKKHASSANSSSTSIKGNKNSVNEDVLITDKNSSKYVKRKPKKPSPKKAISKPQVEQEIPKIKQEHVSLPPSAISTNFTSTPIEGNINLVKEDILIIPTVMNPSLRAKNEHSPKYINLRKQNKLSRKRAITESRAKQEEPKIKKEYVSEPSAVSTNLTSTNSTCAPKERNKDFKKGNVSDTPLFLTSLKKEAKSKSQVKQETPKIKKELVSIPPSFAIKGNINSKKEDVLKTPTVMNPCLRAKKMHSSKYVNLNTKKPSARKSASKPRVKQAKPVIKRELNLNFPSPPFSTPAATSGRYFKTTPDDARITPEILKGVMTAHKHSPAYFHLKNKNFNTGDFKFATPRGNRDIQIFTPEEEVKFLTELLPKDKIGQIVDPKEMNAEIFKNDLPCSDSDNDINKFDFDALEKQRKKNRKKKGKKSLGYDGKPLSDDEILTKWDKYLYDSDDSIDVDKVDFSLLHPLYDED